MYIDTPPPKLKLIMLKKLLNQLNTEMTKEDLTVFQDNLFYVRIDRDYGRDDEGMVSMHWVYYGYRNKKYDTMNYGHVVVALHKDEYDAYASIYNKLYLILATKD